jgi:type I restriction enzyme, S subunit
MMASEWRLRRLDELGFVGRGKSRHRPRNDERLYGGAYPFVQTADIMAADPYITNYSKTYSEFGLQQSKMWEPNTLCMTIAGANTARTAILKIEACFPDSVVGFVADEAKADLYFVKYSLDLMKNKFLAVSRGATQDNLSLDKLLSFPLRVPNVEIQQRIGAVLSAYDDLIENNNRRIKILEEMAQLIYREWFVKFRFPGHEETKLVRSGAGTMPTGWEARLLSELAEIHKGKKPQTVSQVQENSSVPHLLLDAIEGGTQTYSSPEGMVIVEPDDVVMVMDGARSGVVFNGLSGSIGSTLARFRSQDKTKMSPFFLMLMLQDRQIEIRAKNVGAAIPHANKDFLHNMKVIVPPARMNAQFHSVCEPLFSLRTILVNTIRNLRVTRDLLFPKLVSGEIRIERLDAVPADRIA